MVSHACVLAKLVESLITCSRALQGKEFSWFCTKGNICWRDNSIVTHHHYLEEDARVRTVMSYARMLDMNSST